MPKLMCASCYIQTTLITHIASWVFSGHLWVVYSPFLVLWCFLILNREHGTCWNWPSNPFFFFFLSLLAISVSENCISLPVEWLHSIYCLAANLHKWNWHPALWWQSSHMMSWFCHSFMHACIHSFCFIIDSCSNACRDRPSHSLQPVLIDRIVISLINLIWTFNAQMSVFVGLIVNKDLLLRNFGIGICCHVKWNQNM